MKNDLCKNIFLEGSAELALSTLILKVCRYGVIQVSMTHTLMEVRFRRKKEEK